jgi:hypothetical protein
MPHLFHLCTIFLLSYLSCFEFDAFIFYENVQMHLQKSYAYRILPGNDACG